MKTLSIVLGFGLLLGGTTRHLQASPITQIVVFGDSLCDTGNVFLATSLLTPENVTPPSPPFYQGRFSNGPVWIERLADRLGLEVQPSFAEGTNYAFGGAETGPGLSRLGSFNIHTQVEIYLDESPTPGESDLFVIWGGANDLLGSIETGKPFDAAASVENLADSISALYDGGATRFFVPNLPPMGRTPWLGSLGRQAEADQMAADFNAALDLRLGLLRSELDASIEQLDVHSLYLQVLADPTGYGLANVTDSALNEASGEIVDDPQTYLFWDDVHPTGTAHQIIADRAAIVLGIPEPSVLVLLVMGVVGWLAWSRRMRRQC